jgi:hypothetical protein
MKRRDDLPGEASGTIIMVPREILWDYREAPADTLWRLQRIADFFPLYGRDRETVAALYELKEKLRIDVTTKLLIEEYEAAWEEKSGRDRG